MSIADPRLLSLLEQLTNPIQSLNMTLNFNGIYCFPDEWRVSDEANPGIFTYQLKYGSKSIEGGRICPREITDRERRELEEQQNCLYKAKGKKGAKKDGKDIMNQEEEDRLQRLKQQEEQEEMTRLDTFNKLNQQEQIYFGYEDKYRNSILRFEEGKRTSQLEGDEWRSFEDSIYNIGGMWVHLVRMPAIPEEEIQKLKKAKPKNLNLAELMVISYKMWVPLTDFQEPGVMKTLQRCLLQQTSEEWKVEKCYVKVEIEMDQAPTAKIVEVSPSVKQLMEHNGVELVCAPSRSECLQYFQKDINMAMQSLSNEYQNIFQKEANDQKSKISTTMTIQRIQELHKKKEQFLVDINVSGKYKLLKERLRNCIVRLCIDKFQKEGLYTGITQDDKDRLYAELYVYMMEQMQNTLGDFINGNKDEVHEDLVNSFEQNIKDKDRVYSNLNKESVQERYQRLADEYELINLQDQCIKYYNNLISLNPQQHQYLYSYARYCLRVQDFKKAELLVQRALDSHKSEQYQLLLITLLIRRQRYTEAISMTTQLLTKEPINTLYISLMGFIYKLKGDIRMSDKYKHLNQRIYMRTRGLLTTKSLKNIPQNPHTLPNLRQLTYDQQEMAKRAPKLSIEQIDLQQVELIEYLAKNNLMDLVELAMQSILDTTTQKMIVLKAQVLHFKKKYSEALTIYNQFLQTQQKNNFDVFIMKGTLCFETEQLYEAEETFLKAIRVRQTKAFAIYLRLGFIYIKRKSWADAKVILSKGIELNNNSSLCWLGLGVANLRLVEMGAAEECFSQANIYEPFNGEAWGYLALLCLINGKRVQQAEQCLSRMKQTQVNDLELLEELGEQFFDYNNYEESRLLYERILDHKTKCSNLGMLHLKMGKVYDKLGDHQTARKNYMISLENLDGENDKAIVKKLMLQNK